MGVSIIKLCNNGIFNIFKNSVKWI